MGVFVWGLGFGTSAALSVNVWGLGFGVWHFGCAQCKRLAFGVGGLKIIDDLV
jgi:hypothetical protein